MQQSLTWLQQLLFWLNHNQGAIQAFSSVAIMLLTAVIAFATWKYARLTQGLLALSKQQFQRQWQPLLEFELSKADPHRAELKLLNMGSNPIVVTELLVKANRNNPSTSYPLHEPVQTHGGDRLVDIAPQLVKAIEVPPGKRERSRVLLIGVGYEATGYIGMRGYIEYSVRVLNGYVEELVQMTKTPVI